MIIRQTKAGDSEAVSALLRASYPVLMKPSYDSAVLARALENKALAQIPIHFDPAKRQCATAGQLNANVSTV